jgi:hypothetical protein
MESGRRREINDRSGSPQNQRLASLGNVVTEASKIKRIKDGLKSAKYQLLVVSMAMQPPNTT